MTLPDFIGIGAQKAGTSWLARNLAAHPQIWVPPLKELHFFDRPPDWCDPVRRYVDAEADGVPSRGSAWDLRYDRHPRDRAWYEALFEPAPGQVCGEVTPGYAALDDSDVDRVARLLPAARVLFFLRNPIERTWSQTMMYLHRYGLDRDRVGGARLRELFRLPRVVRLSDYPRTLRDWSARYPPERIFVGFFDEIASVPAAVLSRAFAFLRVERSFASPHADARVYARSGRFIPVAAAADLARLHRPIINELDSALGGHASFWRYCADRLLDGSLDRGGRLVLPLSGSALWADWLAAGGGVDGVRSAPLAASAH